MSKKLSGDSQSKNAFKRFFTSRAGYITVSTLVGILFVFAITLIPVAQWYQVNYKGVEFTELLMILLSPKDGTDSGLITKILSAALPYTVTAAFFYIEAVVILAGRKKIFKLLRGALCIICAATLVFSLVFAANAVGFDAGVLTGKTDIYDKYYISPDSVAITANGKPKNLIHIYLESIETTHISSELGGACDTNYIPNLTELALNNVSFSNLESGKVGGFLTLPGTGWTIAALLGATSGVPFSFSISGNSMNNREQFAPGLTTLGDILEEKGYKNMFLCGSDASFGGRLNYFTQHGNYEIYDLDTARSEGKLPNPLYHNGFWGFEDCYLYDIAKEQLTELAAGNQPFNLTMLTVDTHPPKGYICSLCQNEHGEDTENIISCADRQVSEFVEWIKAQPFYEDCVIVITGDHDRMDNYLVPEDGFERRVYNCFINSAAEPAENAQYGRTLTTLDIFPTTLAAMGFTIEGDRLGLGTNMFSGKPTLAEELTFGVFNHELKLSSDYYFYMFEYPELEWKKEEKESI